MRNLTNTQTIIILCAFLAVVLIGLVGVVGYFHDKNSEPASSEPDTEFVASDELYYEYGVDVPPDLIEDYSDKMCSLYDEGFHVNQAIYRFMNDEPWKYTMSPLDYGYFDHMAVHYVLTQYFCPHHFRTVRDWPGSPN